MLLDAIYRLKQEERIGMPRGQDEALVELVSDLSVVFQRRNQEVVKSG